MKEDFVLGGVNNLSQLKYLMRSKMNGERSLIPVDHFKTSEEKQKNIF